jgi:NADPH:quinone reductase-like Zn-dependent oxidoreductase
MGSLAAATAVRTLSPHDPAIRIHRHGGPEVLSMESLEVGKPKPGEIRIRHRAIGVNFIDIYHRTGLYPNELPFTPGVEGVGEIQVVGAGVSDWRPGTAWPMSVARSAGMRESVVSQSIGQSRSLPMSRMTSLLAECSVE